MKNTNNKIIYITNIPTPYKISMLNSLAEKIDNFKVYFMAKSVYIRQWDSLLLNVKFKYDILNSFKLTIMKKEWVIFLNFSLLYKIIQSRPNVIIFGPYSQPYIFYILLYKLIFNSKIILWNESSHETSDFNNKLVILIKRILFNFIDAIVVPGTRIMNSMLNFYKINKNKLFLAPHSVDNNYFNKESKKYRKNKEYWKKRLNLNDRNILYVGQLIKRKNVFTLIKAYEILNLEYTSLFIIGNGPLKNILKDYCHNNMLENVNFLPNLQQNELIKYYTLCDVLILPSFKEVWGMVVNESMACGTPVICSKEVTSGYDLIIPSKTGYVFNPNDFNDLKGVLLTFYKDQEKNNFNLNISQMLNKFTSERMAIGFMNAINFCFER